MKVCEMLFETLCQFFHHLIDHNHSILTLKSSYFYFSSLTKLGLHIESIKIGMKKQMFSKGGKTVKLLTLI